MYTTVYSPALSGLNTPFLTYDITPQEFLTHTCNSISSVAEILSESVALATEIF